MYLGQRMSAKIYFHFKNLFLDSNILEKTVSNGFDRSFYQKYAFKPCIIWHKTQSLETCPLLKKNIHTVAKIWFGSHLHQRRILV